MKNSSIFLTLPLSEKFEPHFVKIAGVAVIQVQKKNARVFVTPRVSPPAKGSVCRELRGSGGAQAEWCGYTTAGKLRCKSYRGKYDEI